MCNRTTSLVLNLVWTRNDKMRHEQNVADIIFRSFKTRVPHFFFAAVNSLINSSILRKTFAIICLPQKRWKKMIFPHFDSIQLAFQLWCQTTAHSLLSQCNFFTTFQYNTCAKNIQSDEILMRLFQPAGDVRLVWWRTRWTIWQHAWSTLAGGCKSHIVLNA